MAAASAFSTCQNTIASTPTATVSLVSACSAVIIVVWIRRSITWATASMTRKHKINAGTLHLVKPSKPQDDRALPFRGDADRSGQDEQDDNDDDGKGDTHGQLQDRSASI